MLFISPSAAQQAWRFCQLLLCIDAAFTKTSFQHVLALATGTDANNESINFAWGILPEESTETWTWFKKYLKIALNEVNRKSVIIMSDRQKGLVKAKGEVFPAATEVRSGLTLKRG